MRFPDFNAEVTSNLAVRASLGTACPKPASTSSVTVFWFRTPRMNFAVAGGKLLLARASGATSGDDGYIRITQDCSTLEFAMRAGGTLHAALTLTGLQRNTTYCVIFASRNGYVHLIAATPGSTSLRASAVNTNMFDFNYSTAGNELWEWIGASGNATPKAFNGPIEEFCFWRGTFPETSAGVPDAALIRAIADGSQDLTTLASRLGPQGDAAGAAASLRCRFPMKHSADIASSHGVATNDLGRSNRDATKNAILHACGPLRPVPLMPALTQDCVSQVVFATPGEAATATAQIKVEGGSYSGLPAMARVQVRLLNEARAVVADWIDLTTTAPVGGAGTWAPSEGFSGVLMQASWLTREFQALDSGGNVIAGPVSGYGLSGAGFCLVAQAQSQLAQLIYGLRNYTLPLGTRFVGVRQEGNAFVPGDPGLGEADKPPNPYTTEVYNLGNGISSNWGMGPGIRIMAAEINALYPGVPVQFSNLSLGGTSLAQYTGDASELGPRWAALRDGLGIVQPFILMFFGHSSGTSSTQADLAALVTYSQARLGTPLRYMHVPVPRYRAAGTGSNFTATSGSRNGARAFVLANPGDLHWWMGSWSNVFTDFVTGDSRAEVSSGSNPHPAQGGLFGQTRTGSLIGLSMLMATRAVLDVPIGITAAEVVSPTRVKLVIGAVNA